MIRSRFADALRRLVPDRLTRRHEPRISRGPFAIAHDEEATIAEGDATWVMRHSSYPMWTDLRSKLFDCGIDPGAAVIADSYGLDPIGVEIRIVVADGRVIRYRYSTGFDEWNDITDTWRDDASAELVEGAFVKLRKP